MAGPGHTMLRQPFEFHIGKVITMQRIQQRTTASNSRRYQLRIENLEQREAPSLLFVQLDQWVGKPVPAAPSEVGQRLTAGTLRSNAHANEQPTRIFDLPLGEMQNVAVVTNQNDLQGQSVTPVAGTLLQDPFGPSAGSPARLGRAAISPAQEISASLTAGAAEAVPASYSAAASAGNSLFSAVSATPGDALWSALNGGNGGTITESGDFTEAVYATGLSEATGMAWAPDGTNRLFIPLKGGNVRIIENGVLLPTPFATVTPIYTGSECGLIGIAFDPDYLSNGYIYFFVTVSSSEQQIIRYTDAGNVGVDKTTIIAGLPTNGNNHDGGAVGFGIDGKLYWAIGDLGNGTGVNDDLTSLAAKVGRANRDGSVPGDNPFDDGDGPNNDYIWARGLRNPYTFTFMPWTNQLWVNSVGTSYEQVFVMNAGDHAGYNRYENNQPEGFITPVIKYRTNGTDTRNITTAGAVREGEIVTFTHNAPPSNQVFRRGEKIEVRGVADASFNDDYYILDVPTPTTFRVVQAGPDATSGGGTAQTQNQGGCLTGGTFYSSNAFPAEYQLNFYYGDCNSGRMMRATLDENLTVNSVDHFRRPLTNSYIDAEVGPDGALYSVYHGGQVYRLSYNQTQQKLIVSPQHLTIDENGQAAFNVSLATAPTKDIVVTVGYDSGDADIVLTSGKTLTFTPDNWFTPQPAYLYAFPDADSDLDYTFFSVSASGVPTEFVYVTGRDSMV